MAQHFVKVVDDGALASGDGWAIVRCEETKDLYFVVEETAATSAAILSAAWKAAANFVIEEAVREGIVRYVDRPDT